ncbi:hypothetical protein QOZ80_7BG0613740 [Eleusine coracana subsp. coracana]|nr:hypothetical protein QOZ80_7BG0613740 [Eleusine coracana subsp. coracana]
MALWQPRSVPTRATIYNVDMGAVLADGPLLPPELHHLCSVVAAAGKIFALHTLEEERSRGLFMKNIKPHDDKWTWTSACTPPLRLPLPGTPDRPLQITSYALHPDGHTFFVFGGHSGTFSLDTRCVVGEEWRHHGEWLLPFFGQGHYDATLHAWMIKWTLIPAKDLFVTDPENNILRDRSLMTLACLGNAEFCILESLTKWGTDLAYDMDVDYVLRITKFRLKRTRRGHLQPSSRRLVRSYDMHKFDSLFAPRAFLIS